MSKKRHDLTRARVNGVVHVVPPRLRSPNDELVQMWPDTDGRGFLNHTACGRVFRHATLPESTQVTCMECLGMTDVELLFREVERMKADHNRICTLVADMFAAATGRVGHGPERGVVEDIADVRKRAILAEDKIKSLEAALLVLRAENEALRLIVLSA